MDARQFARTTSKWLAAGTGLAAGSYLTYAGLTWLRFGNAKPPDESEADPLLERFIPRYDVVERQSLRVKAPATTTFSVACETDLEGPAIVRAIIRSREWILGAESGRGSSRPRGILAHTQSMGWGVLAQRPGLEIVMGSVTKPWEPSPIFRALPPDAFQEFNTPGYVKIVWTLRADPIDERRSIFRTETRAVATDEIARRRFRTYWSFLSPGIVLIRTAVIFSVRAEAERRFSYLDQNRGLAMNTEDV